MSFLEKLGERAGNTLLANQTGSAGALTDFTVPEDRIVARLTGENVKAASPSEIATMLSSDVVTIAGAQTVTGAKQFNDITVAGILMSTVSTTTFQTELAAPAKTQLTILSAGDADADLRLQRETGSIQFEASLKSTAIWYNVNQATFTHIWNTNRNDISHRFYGGSIGTFNDNLLKIFAASADASQGIGIGTNLLGANAVLHIETSAAPTKGVLLGGSADAMDASAVFQANSTTKGFLPPRNANPAGNITSPATGLMAYDSTDDELQYYDGSAWKSVGVAGEAAVEYGEITVTGGSTGQGPTDTTAGTFELVTTWNADGANGLSSSGITPQNTSNNILLATAGRYKVEFSCAFTGTAGDYAFRGFLNGSPQTNLTTERTISGGSDQGSISFCGFINTTTGTDTIDVRVDTGTNAETFTIREATLQVIRVGDAV